mgnify:FL=1
MVRVSAPLVVLLGRARTAGLHITATDGRLRVTGPREHGALARALLARKPDVLTLVDAYNGRRRLLDWQAAAVRDPRPCVLCGRPALLRDPYDGVPMHRTCAERAVRWGLPTTSVQGAVTAA